MADVGGLIRDLRRRAEDEAYWRALEQLFGSNSPVLRAVLAARVQDPSLTERERVAKGLADLLPHCGRLLEEAALRGAAVGPPAALGEAVERVGIHDHLIHFRGDIPELAGALTFIEEGLRRGAKVLCLYPSAGIANLRAALAARSPAGDPGLERLAFIPLDPYIPAGGGEEQVEEALRAVEEGLRGAARQGCREVWLSGHLAGRLFDQCRHDLNARWEARLHRLARDEPLAVYCSYGDAEGVDARTVEDLLGSHTWVACGGEAYPLRLGRGS